MSGTHVTIVAAGAVKDAPRRPTAALRRSDDAWPGTDDVTELYHDVGISHAEIGTPHPPSGT
ncbi:MAG: hypothetical protein JXA67_22635 [Micromonosporaceae bacterium]|nr:hypothetical protein [Micromonosporaceae bacterium]